MMGTEGKYYNNKLNNNLNKIKINDDSYIFILL